MGEALDIVLADDQVVMLDALTALLNQVGHRVVGTVGTCSALLTCVAEVHPDICVLGNRFPDGEGVEAIEMLTQFSPSTKAVMLTGQDDTDTMRRALDAGACGYVHKSRGAGVLIDVLRRVAAGEIVVEGSFLRTRSVTIPGHPQLRRLATYLTHREYECLALLAEGMDTASMATRLGVSQTTVRSHVQAVLTKLGVHSRLEAASVATRYGLLQTGHGPRPKASGWQP